MNCQYATFFSYFLTIRYRATYSFHRILPTINTCCDGNVHKKIPQSHEISLVSLLSRKPSLVN